MPFDIRPSKNARATISTCPSVFSSVQFSHSVISDSLWPHERQHTRLPVYHQLPEFTQTHVYWVGNAFQPSHPLSSPLPPTFNLSQKQGLFQGVSSSYQVAKVLEFQLQHQSFRWIFRPDFPLGWTGWISLQSKGLSRVFSNTTVPSINSSAPKALESKKETYKSFALL